VHKSRFEFPDRLNNCSGHPPDLGLIADSQKTQNEETRPERDSAISGAMFHRTVIFLSILAGCLTTGVAAEQPAAPPRAISVLPVFFVPSGQASPSQDELKRLMRHLMWSQTRYRELLGQKTTFAIAEQKPRVYHAQRPLEFYRTQPERSAAQVVSELLADLNCNRYNCPFVLLVVIMNPKDDFPPGWGQPLNGGFNTGGGVSFLSSFGLDRSPYFQSTLQHELGHAFGLPHVDVYGYDMKTNASMMSYDPRHHTKGFTDSRKPGKFIPEDRRGLALNTRAFPSLHFDPEKDIPRGYSIAKIVTLGPLKIPGQPDGPLVTTHSGEEYKSKVANVVQGRITENERNGTVTFDARTMWHSAKTATGWVAVQVTFPYEVELTRIVVHSQHSGQYHIAKAVRVAVGDNGEHLRQVVEKNLDSADSEVSFPTSKGRVWQLELRADETGEVTLRGLQFFSGEDELFPPLVPYGG
jgi:hypothetical protein